MTRRALIVGAGIAGPVLAIALTRVGYACHVVEARSEPATRAAGSWLTLAVNGLRALAHLGLAERVLRVGFPSRAIALYNGRGQHLGDASLGGLLADGTPTQTLKRSQLVGVLHDAARAAGVRFSFDTALVGVEEVAGGIRAALSDGRVHHADTLLGADGAHSRVRVLIDPRARGPRATGMGNVGGFVPAAAAPALALPPGSYRMIFGRRAFFGYVVHPTGDVWWFANPPTPFPEATDVAWLAQLYDGDHGPAAALVRATPHPLTFALQWELPRVVRWSRGAIGILGDAAHAASPSSGQGASLAIEDALELARRLHGPSIPEALTDFAAARRARVERVVAEAARTSAHKVPGVLGAWLRDALLPRVLAYAARDPRAWLYDHDIAWSVE